VVVVIEPIAVVTVIGPVPAPPGTLTTICVAFDDTIVPGTPLNKTAVGLAKFVPAIVTEVPGKPVNGVKFVMVGEPGALTTKMNSVLSEPFALETLILPLVVPAATVNDNLLDVGVPIIV
jgi:hypothetical protein